MANLRNLVSNFSSGIAAHFQVRQADSQLLALQETPGCELNRVGGGPGPSCQTRQRILGSSGCKMFIQWSVKCSHGTTEAHLKMLNILTNSHLIPLYAPYIFFIIIADYQAICVKGAICREEQFLPLNPLTGAASSLLSTLENSPG